MLLENAVDQGHRTIIWLFESGYAAAPLAVIPQPTVFALACTSTRREGQSKEVNFIIKGMNPPLIWKRIVDGAFSLCGEDPLSRAAPLR